ncbi:RagB/SusD family nutrient uptake outer membrane protein [Sphingobacterium chuzhouense]|uniref:RagB/SusD family nutrient uptake outer membrane protein n=1 Tax=Sphingobacterium chuzhouense TaxID=1742264 RepID=A0ABR7XT67_9SPHI|nr:RagB/SusD family nutrient uptake outer membrane protein [Sphingobacterium chuzhouense]MBD1421699.1 RagB/SusD family nutrient uptake outer membrane protein [Sphingobacterium chuzhouense]
MKKYITKWIAFLSVLLMGSCSFLDKEPISSFSAQGFYKSTSDAQAGVYGIYEAMQSSFQLNFAYWGEGRADAVETNHAGDPFALHQNTLTPIITSSNWNNLYTVISRANYAVKYIPEVFEDETSPLRNQLIGQARALRAIAYFYLVRVWGDVPFTLEPYESIQQDLFLSKTDKETILNQIVEDLSYASEFCSPNYGGERDRVLITRGGADGILTQVYMWRKQYQQAITTAERVTDNPLYSLVSISDWNNMFSAGLSSESVFEVGYNEVQKNSMRVLYALGNDASYFPSQRFMNSFEEGDLRRSKIWDNTQVQPRKIWKFFGEGFNDESPDPSQNNIILVRLADIMLLKAEAHARLNDNSLALPLLNNIRNRAGLVALTEVTAIEEYGDVVSAIMHERSIELCFEGHRWFDLVRTDKAIEVMEPITGLKDSRNILWPIHEDAINRNPNLVQNEFYR